MEGTTKGDFLRVLDSPEAKAWDVEEQFQVLAGTRFFQRMANKMPWIRISNRAFITGINDMNWNIYKGHMRTLERHNLELKKGMLKGQKPGVMGRYEFTSKGKYLHEAQIKRSMSNIAGMLADMSARGPLGPVTKISPALNAGFFSMRTIIGRLISPRHMISGDPFVRRAAWKNMISAVVGMSGVILAGREMGIWDVETDQNSSDFMKPRLFGSRLVIDPWGGSQQFAVLYWRLVSGQQKAIKDGYVRDVNPFNATAQMLGYKIAPFFRNAITLVTQKDWRGQDVDIKDWKMWTKNNIELSVQDAMEAFTAAGLEGAAVGIPGAIAGMGIQGRVLPLQQLSLDTYKNKDGRPLGYNELNKHQRERIRKEFDRRLSSEQKAEQAAKDKAAKEAAKVKEAKAVAQGAQRRGDEPYTPIRDAASNFLDFFKDMGVVEWRSGGVKPTEQPAPGRQPTTTPAGWEGASRMMLPRTRGYVEDWIRTGEPLDRYTRRVLTRIQREQGIPGTLDEWLERLKRDFESRAAGVR